MIFWLTKNRANKNIYINKHFKVEFSVQKIDNAIRALNKTERSTRPDTFETKLAARKGEFWIPTIWVADCKYANYLIGEYFRKAADL